MASIDLEKLKDLLEPRFLKVEILRGTGKKGDDDLDILEIHNLALPKQIYVNTDGEIWTSSVGEVDEATSLNDAVKHVRDITSSVTLGLAGSKSTIDAYKKIRTLAATQSHVYKLAELRKIMALCVCEADCGGACQDDMGAQPQLLEAPVQAQGDEIVNDLLAEPQMEELNLSPEDQNEVVIMVFDDVIASKEEQLNQADAVLATKMAAIMDKWFEHMRFAHIDGDKIEVYYDTKMAFDDTPATVKVLKKHQHGYEVEVVGGKYDGSNLVLTQEQYGANEPHVGQHLKVTLDKDKDDILDVKKMGAEFSSFLREAAKDFRQEFATIYTASLNTFSDKVSSRIPNYFAVRNNVLSEVLEQVKQAGETGPRGGKIIGETKSGKPVYEGGPGHSGHKDFSKQDHDDAFHANVSARDALDPKEIVKHRNHEMDAISHRDARDKTGANFKDYKKEHPGTKKTKSDPMFNEGLDSYKTTALWSSTDDDGEPLDKNHTHDDIHPDTHKKMEKDWKAFSTKHKDMVDKYGPKKVAHDFWLTRNGHGAGFWDGDYDDADGEKLTESAKKHGEFDLYKGDDGKLHG